MGIVSDQAVQAALEYYSEGGCMGLDQSERRDVAISMLEAAAPYLTASVEVGGLEWKGYDDGTDMQSALTPGCGLAIVNGSGWRYLNAAEWHEADNIEEAKAAAQDDYNKRILSALKSKPVDVAAVREQCAQAVENILSDTGEYILRREATTTTATLSPSETINQWRPIATAPKDGTWIIGARFDAQSVTARNISQARYMDDGVNEADWYDDNDDYPCPTHWMPLPAAPTSKRGE